jgi:hypothetical protein
MRFALSGEAPLIQRQNVRSTRGILIFMYGSSGRSTQGVKLLDLEDQDKVAAAVVIPPEEAKTQPEEGTLLQ